MLNKKFYEELAIESQIMNLIKGLSLPGKEVIATLLLDQMEKEGIMPASFVACYLSNKKEIEREKEQFIEL